jgi:hypothetical protein
VDACADHNTPGCDHAKCLRHQAAHRGEQNGGIKFVRRHLVRAAYPDSAKVTGKLLALGIARLRESENLPSLIAGHLGDDVGSCPESVQPQTLGVSGHHQGTIADQPGTQQWSGLGVAVSAGNTEDVTKVGDRVLGVAAVDLIAGEASPQAEILAPSEAVAAAAAGLPQPRDANPFPWIQAVDALACRDHGADDLVAENEGQLGLE